LTNAGEIRGQEKRSAGSLHGAIFLSGGGGGGDHRSNPQHAFVAMGGGRGGTKKPNNMHGKKGIGSPVTGVPMVGLVTTVTEVWHGKIKYL